MGSEHSQSVSGDLVWELVVQNADGRWEGLLKERVGACMIEVTGLASCSGPCSGPCLDGEKVRGTCRVDCGRTEEHWGTVGHRNW